MAAISAAAAAAAAATNVIESENVNYLRTELGSLAIDCKRTNELNDNEELEALANAIKGIYYQDYKTAYNVSGIEIDQLQFDHSI
jgi:hypothetical protein